MLIDANLLLYAADASAPQHRRAVRWIADQLNGTRRVGIP
jgi:predicted nucleic acid-binding protein